MVPRPGHRATGGRPSGVEVAGLEGYTKPVTHRGARR